MDQDPLGDPLFKGLTRSATVAGVPLIPLGMMLGVVAFTALWTSFWAYLMAPPLYLVMRIVTRKDDKAFRIWGLWFETKWRNSHKKHWGASSYSPRAYKRR